VPYTAALCSSPHLDGAEQSPCAGQKRTHGCLHTQLGQSGAAGLGHKGRWKQRRQLSAESMPARPGNRRKHERRLVLANFLASVALAQAMTLMAAVLAQELLTIAQQVG